MATATGGLDAVGDGVGEPQRPGTDVDGVEIAADGASKDTEKDKIGTVVDNATHNPEKESITAKVDESARTHSFHNQEIKPSLTIHSSDAHSDYVLDIVVLRSRKDGHNKTTNQGQHVEKSPTSEPVTEAGSDPDIEAQSVQRRSGDGGRRGSRAVNLADLEKAANERNWVTDPEMLPAVIPTARILEFTFSDEGPRIGRTNTAALELLWSLKASRTACPNRPMIFIAHRLATEVLNELLLLPHDLARQMFFRPRIPSEEKDAKPTYPSIPTATASAIPDREPETSENSRRRSKDSDDSSKVKLAKRTSLSIVVGIFLLEIPSIPSRTLKIAVEQGIPLRLYNKKDWKNRQYRHHLELIKVISEVESGSMNKFSGTDDDNYVRLRRDLQQMFRHDCFLDAAFKNDYGTMKKLLDARLDPNRPKRFGLSTLHIVASLGYVDLVELLLAYGADVTAKASDDQGTPLQIAAQNLYPEVVYLLLRKGAPTDVFDNKGFDFAKFTAEQRHRLSTPSITKDEQTKVQEVCEYLENPPLAEGPLMDDHSGDYFLDEPALPPARYGKEACLAYGITTCEFYNFATALSDGVPEKTPMTEFRTVKSHSVRDVLYTDILAKTSEEVKPHVHDQGLMFTWYHIPANNTAWVEGLFIKLKLQKWLQLDSYEHRGRTPHSRVMMPGITKLGKDEKSQNLSLFAPYLKTEQQVFQKKMAKIIEQEERNKYWNRMFPGQDKLKPGRNGEVIPDKYLIKAYLNEHRGLHIRRTLDQSHYSMLPDTKARDKDQVLLRHGNRRPMVVLVDQLWLWVIGDVLITSFPQRWDHNHREGQDVLGTIMAYLRRRDRQPVLSALDMASVIIEHCVGLLNLDTSRRNPEYEIIDTYAAALGKCANEETVLLKKFHSNILRLSRLRSAIMPKKKQKSSIFDSSTDSDTNSSSSSTFGSSTDSSDSSDTSSTASSRSNVMYMGGPDSKEDRKANRKLKKRQLILRKSPKKVETHLLNSFNNITQETTQLIEIKDIKDELGMLIEVLESQQQAVESFLSMVPAKREVLIRTVKKGREQIGRLKQMSNQSEEIFEALNHLLDLKQKQANASEARTANVQAEQADKQGKTLMVFTTVTIIFLPLSFMAAFFAMPVKEFPKTPSGDTSMTLSFVSKWIFPISIAISIPFLLLAFSVNAISKTFSSFRRSVTAAALIRSSAYGGGVMEARGWKRKRLQAKWFFVILWRVIRRIWRPVKRFYWRRQWWKTPKRWRRRFRRKFGRKRRGSGTSSGSSTTILSD